MKAMLRYEAGIMQQMLLENGVTWKMFMRFGFLFVEIQGFA